MFNLLSTLPKKGDILAFMKTRNISMILLIAVTAVFALSSCNSFVDAVVVPKDAPKEVADAVRKAPKGVLIGIGKTTGSGSANLSETIAVTRARTLISRQLNTMVRDMVSMYQAASTVDPSAAIAFEENISVVLSSSTLTGSTVLCQTEDASGVYWAVVALTKFEAKKEIERAQNLAAQRMASRPGGNNIDITNNFDNAFDKAASEGAKF